MLKCRPNRTDTFRQVVSFVGALFLQRVLACHLLFLRRLRLSQHLPLRKIHVRQCFPLPRLLASHRNDPALGHISTEHSAHRSTVALAWRESMEPHGSAVERPPSPEMLAWFDSMNCRRIVPSQTMLRGL